MDSFSFSLELVHATIFIPKQIKSKYSCFPFAHTDITLYKIDIANMLHNIYLISRHRASLIFICQCVVLAVFCLEFEKNSFSVTRFAVML